MGALNTRSRDFPIVLFEAADVTAMNALTGMKAYDLCILDNGDKYEYKGSTAGWKIYEIGTRTLLDAVTSTGAGSSFNGSEGSFSAVANGTSGAFSATVLVQVSNDGTNWLTGITFTLSGTATTADVAGDTIIAEWVYCRGNVTAISGTGANVTLVQKGV